MRHGLLSPTAFFIEASLLMLAAPCLVAQTGTQQPSAPPVQITLPASRSSANRKQYVKTQSQRAQLQAKLVDKSRLAPQRYLAPTGPWQVQANRLVWQPLPRLPQPQPFVLAQVNWQAVQQAQQAQQQLLMQLQPNIIQPQPLPQAQAMSRNLLFTPQDAAQTQTFHPLLTPDIRAYVVPVIVPAELNPVLPHK